MIKNVLITGADGQVGSELRELIENEKYQLLDVNFYFTTRKILDITHQKSVENFIQENKIDTIINCAAYTAVDEAEKQEAMANKVNKEAVEVLADIATKNNIFLLHLSTDYVFGGDHYAPFNEDEPTNPQGVYAYSKLAGEEAIQKSAPRHALIIRTSWIYSEFGHNFLHTMLKLGHSKNEISVVCDQIGTPTYARDLAATILTILQQHKQKLPEGVHVYHYSNEGSCSWYDFAQAIFEIAHLSCKVQPIYTDEYPTLAKRPHYSVLNKKKIKEAYGIEIPYWRDSLEKCIQRVDKENKRHKIGIIGSGFIATGLANQLMQNPEYEVAGILTRTDINARKDFLQNKLLTNSLDDLIATSDLIVECSGDAIYATETIDRILKANIPVVTMNSEFHVTTGSYFVDKGLITEAEGDQPGVLAILHEEAIDMGFKPVVYANIKGFLNENPSREDMEYWGARSNLSLEMVTSFTDGTKVQIEQTLVANGFGADIIKESLVKLENDDMLEGGTLLAQEAKAAGISGAVSDYLLSSKLPAGVFILAEHDQEQHDALKYYKLGDGPYYVLERTYHICHLEIIKTIKRVLHGGGVLLNNSQTPRFSVAAIAKRDLKVGESIIKAIGSFDVRGETVRIDEHLSHVPIGLLANATIKKEIKEGEIVTFDDVDLPKSLALSIWEQIISSR
ncbi:MAG: dTDP-4-dehydrorhamnose reductase [Sulfurovum sp.]|nr:MAG: dTDP-4-dehydrorhamnose reductase [Sulfurovum sp.]RUM75150.1 MAG: dTDP-4-dehydrorhamnose reductase [Sulfurovum sp.]